MSELPNETEFDTITYWEHIMKYLCLVYVEEKVLNAMPQHERIAALE